MKQTLEEDFKTWCDGRSSYDKSDVLNFGAEWQKQFNSTSQVNRVEVIQHSPPYNGRAYTNYDAKDVEIQIQDDGTTLKIFLK